MALGGPTWVLNQQSEDILGSDSILDGPHSFIIKL